MKLKEIYRTSTFAWSPTASLPLLATGTVAGALDESFSNESRLEIWEPDFLAREEFHLGRDDEHGPKHVVRDSSRYNRLAWGAVDGRPQGIIAAGLENGELALWDPAQILAGADTSELLILRNTTHTGPVRGLDFNPIQTSLLATGGVSGEVYIWDLKDPSKPYTPTPGTRSTKLDEITSVAWNQQVQYVLAGASTTGYTVVWDLRGKREVVALAYGGGAGTLAGQLGTTGSLAVGGRRGMSDIAWHPDNATRVVTASEDDTSPIIMVWDLRNARAPEKILTGHEKGVLSLSWCKQDADLLLSCGKDNRVLCWNPQTSEIIGELPSADNWAFQVDWCPRNPNLLATAFFDGTIGIHSLQSTNEPTTDRSAAAHTNGADIFDSTSISRASHGTFSLKQPPKWLRRPASSSFGFGGKLVTVSNLTNAQGKAQSSVVHIRKVATEQALIERAIKLQAAIEDDTLQSFAEARIQENETEPASEGWKALLSLFKANSRDELVMLLGFSQSEVAERVSEAIEKLKAAAANKSPEETDDFIDGTPREPVVSFAEPEREESEESDVEDAGPGSGETDKTPSEISASVTSDTASGVRQADAESTTTAPSLFGDDFGPGTPQEDFFNTIVQNDDGHHSVIIPHTNYGLDSSVAATIGSGPSSVTSESMKSNTFKIYPTDESETDRLVTKALVLGDFESAVSLCLSSDRFADAILLAVRGGPELLQRTQKAYFERRTTALPYLRLFQSIVTNDLSDIVQNADLQEWKEIFVVLCTFATNEEFSSLAEQLGSRLEYQFVIAKDSDNYIQADEYRKNATLTYLAAARLERLVNIWNEELAEEEKKTEFDGSDDESLYSAHVHSLQTFIEKVTAFRSATKYVDDDLSQKSDSNTAATIKTYKLSALYDRYFEYAEVLATQGLVKEAATFLKLTPSDYKGTTGTDLAVERERVFAASGAAPAPVASTSRQPVASTTVAQTTSYGGYPNYGVAPAVQPVAVPPVPQTTYSVYNPPAVTTNTGYAPNTYAPATTQAPYAAQPLQPQHQPAQAIPPPPRGHTGTPSHPPPPPKKDNSGWNDAPVVAAARAPSNLNLNKPAAITSPFPNATPSPGYSPTGSPYMNQGQAAAIPPPPRPNSVQQRAQIPPPPSGHKMAPPPPPQAGSGFHPGPRPGSQVGIMPPSLSHQVGHVGGQVPPRQPTPGQYASPPSRGSAGSVPPPGLPPAGQMGGRGPMMMGAPPQQQSLGQPPSVYSRATPPPGQFGPPGGPEGPVGVHPMQSPPQPHHMQGHPQHMQHPPPPTGPYAPPPQQQQGGPRMPPPQVGHQQSGPSHIMPPQQGMPPSQSMQHPPPPGGPSRGGPTQGSPAAPAKPQGPPPPKYPPGDRSHIPDHAKPAYNVINEHLNRMRQTTPPQQKRLADDLERRLNPLFDALNCETLSAPVVEQLLVLTKAMEAHDRPAALAIHVDLLTRGSQTDDIGLWMSGIKQLIMRM